MNDLLIVALAGLAAGLMNTVVGGGTLITYPTLLALGLPPLTANVTSAVGVFPGSLAGAWAYRRTLLDPRNRAQAVRSLIGITIGVAIGLPLLLLFPPTVFGHVSPWLILGAGLLTVAQPWIRSRVAEHTQRPRHHALVFWIGVIAAGIYLAYFGGATGVILLAVFLYTTTHDLQVANALKNLNSGTGNGIAAIVFLFLAPVQIGLSIAIAVGSIIGGVIGARFAQRLSPRVFRVLIGVIAVIATLTAFRG